MNYDVQHNLGLKKHEYYGPLLYSYIDTILRSGELLEDDFQAILSVFRVEQFHIDKKTYVPYNLIASASSLVPSVVATKIFGSLFYLVPSAVLTTGFTLYYLSERKKRCNHELLIDMFIRIIKSIQVLNRRISKYLLERKNHSNKYSHDFFQPLTNTVNSFVKVLSKQQSDFQKMIISHICNLSEYCNPLREDCVLFKDFESNNLIKLEEDGFNNCLKYTKDVIDFQQLLNSKLLSYFAVVCCWEERPISKEVLDNFINDKIPLLAKLLEDHHNNISEMFHSLRSTVTRLSERELGNKTIIKAQMSGKLRQALDSSVNNLCFVLEKLHNIIDIMEKSDENVDHKKIDDALIDLRGHAADTYEALDILCKLHGILSENKQNVNDRSTEKLVKTVQRDEPQSLQQKVQIDPRDQIEDKEKYELYLKASEKIEHIEPAYEEVSNTYMRLMIKELKQNLNQHAFYVSAKKRWKDDSDEDLSDGGMSGDENSSCDGEDTENEITVRENPLFSCTTESLFSDKVNAVPTSTSNCEVSKNIQITNIDRKGKVENENDSSSRTDDDFSKIDTLTRTVEIEEQDKWNPILKGIKALSQNVRLVEETFGEDEESD